MSLRHALLGMLAYEPSSGYDLKKAFTRELGEYAWHAPHTRIYPELNALADEHLIEVVDEGARGRRVYATTDAGREELRRWLFLPTEHGKARNTDTLKLFLLTSLDSEDMRALLRQHADESAREVEKLTAVVVELDAGLKPGERPQLGRMAAEFGLRLHQARRDWALWALDRVAASR
ncbi:MULTISPECIES: PadR family transcriptional regulator [Thermomonosporaceae]|uniref:PadR family transcriptional regulator n=1 Tax=Thermomonosporaceae TaxID=2012 RepID=UPI00255AFD63|nr:MULTISPECIES: PadR family transcriptional regulator [Thermomonosporaceae]MDL4773545.1 PadR family transcriptional regulator [Actinomadura xylanilytica]